MKEIIIKIMFYLIKRYVDKGTSIGRCDGKDYIIEITRSTREHHIEGLKARYEYYSRLGNELPVTEVMEQNPDCYQDMNGIKNVYRCATVCCGNCMAAPKKQD